MASSISATSPTVRPMGPFDTLAVDGPMGRTVGDVAQGTRPGLGRKPTTEQKLAGVRRLPPRSEPVASQAMPVASATAEPPEEPPQVRRRFHGLTVLPKTGLKVLAPAANSGVLDFASTTAPLRSKVSTTR